VEELKNRGGTPGEFEKPVLLKHIKDLADLKEGMVLDGVVRNVTDFGAFVDIGVHGTALSIFPRSPKNSSAIRGSFVGGTKSQGESAVGGQGKKPNLPYYERVKLSKKRPNRKENPAIWSFLCNVYKN
jgi:hypothetical protein